MTEAESATLLHENEGLLEPDTATMSPDWSSNIAPSSAWHRVLIYVFLLKFTKTFYYYILELPLVRLIERAICQAYYESKGTIPDWKHVDEALCKLPVVQDKLAQIMGWRLTFISLPGLLTSVFYGALADRFGRRPLVALGTAVEILALAWVLLVCYSDTRIKIQFVWLEGLFYFVGGGGRFLYAMLFTMVADVVPAENRSRTFFFLHALAHGTRLPALYLSTTFMNSRLWMPFLLAMCSQLAALIILRVMPETLPSVSSAAYHRLGHHTDDVNNAESPNVHSAPLEYQADASLFHRLRKLLQHRGLSIILGFFILKKIAFASASESFIYQYTSEKWNLKLSQIYPVRISYIIGAVLINLVILPLVIRLWRPKHSYQPIWDLNVARFCLVNGLIGFMIIWRALAFAVLCFGTFLVGLMEGLEPSLQAVASYIAGRSMSATLFTTITMMDTLAEMVAGPVIGGLLTIRDADGNSLGLCFLASAILVFALLLGTWGIRTTPLVT